MPSNNDGELNEVLAVPWPVTARLAGAGVLQWSRPERVTRNPDECGIFRTVHRNIDPGRYLARIPHIRRVAHWLVHDTNGLRQLMW